MNVIIRYSSDYLIMPTVFNFIFISKLKLPITILEWTERQKLNSFDHPFQYSTSLNDISLFWIFLRIQATCKICRYFMEGGVINFQFHVTSKHLVFIPWYVWKVSEMMQWSIYHVAYNWTSYQGCLKLSTFWFRVHMIKKIRRWFYESTWNPSRLYINF